MRKRFPRSLAGGVAAALLLVTFLPSVASAHERRDVGKLQFVVGWIGEPSLVGQPNGIDLRITDKATGQPVDGAEKTLKATIAFGGGQPKEFPLRARFGQKGAYTADIIPTKAGAYVFTFTGAVGDQSVNEKFESGPGRFDDVQTLDSLQFPQVVPAPDQLQAQAQAADARAGQAQTFGYAGIALGLVGIVLGGLSLMRRPKAAA
jgi:hypothetical protein